MGTVGTTPNGFKFIRISSPTPKNIQEGSAEIICEDIEILSHPQLVLLNAPDEKTLNFATQRVNWSAKSPMRSCPTSGATGSQGGHIARARNHWVNCPLPGDIVKRILLLHSNQIPQFTHCLVKSGQECAGNLRTGKKGSLEHFASLVF